MSLLEKQPKAAKQYLERILAKDQFYSAGGNKNPFFSVIFFDAGRNISHTFCHDIVNSSIKKANDNCFFVIKNLIEENINERANKIREVYEKYLGFFNFSPDEVEVVVLKENLIGIIFKDVISANKLYALLKFARLSYYITREEPLLQIILNHFINEQYKTDSDVITGSSIEFVDAICNNFDKYKSHSYYFYQCPPSINKQPKITRLNKEFVKNQIADIAIENIKGEILKKCFKGDSPILKNVIFAYGTLRKGFYNFSRFYSMKYIDTIEIKGYDLWDLGPYPCIVENPSGKIIVDIITCSSADKKIIDSMEEGAGYTKQEITIKYLDTYDISGTIYKFNKIPQNATKINGGDYSKKSS